VDYIFAADSIYSLRISVYFKTIMPESQSIHANRFGGAEFAGPKNDGPKKIKDWKMQDLKMTDQIAGLENAGPGK